MTAAHFSLTGNYAPVHDELDIADLPVAGSLPPGLAGTLYRVGPNPQFAPRDTMHHWFAGDGMVHAFHIGDGKVAYRNRWMRTPKWQLENRAGKALFGTFGHPATSDPAVVGLGTGTANTNIVAHAGMLLALEESHRPFEFDPVTLASKGYRDFGGAIGARFTAHPRPDPATGELHFFAYSAAGPGTTDMQYGVLDGAGRVARFEVFQAPYPSMVHDFVVTAGHVLFPVTPLTSSMQRVMRGQPLFAWESGRAVLIGLMPKGGGAAIRWLETRACHVFHFMNAWEADGRIVVLAMEAEMAPGMPHADGRPGEPGKSAARLTRWDIDPGADGATIVHTILDDVPAEFPRIDERFAGSRNRYGWYLCHADGAARDQARQALYGTLTCHDFATGRKERYTLPDGDVLSEPVFAPRHATAQEGDGWILATAWRRARQCSDLLVFDATAIEAGPVAVVGLPRRIPFGFHGAWLARTQP